MTKILERILTLNLTVLVLLTPFVGHAAQDNSDLQLAPGPFIDVKIAVDRVEALESIYDLLQFRHSTKGQDSSSHSVREHVRRLRNVARHFRDAASRLHHAADLRGAAAADREAANGQFSRIAATLNLDPRADSDLIDMVLSLIEDAKADDEHAKADEAQASAERDKAAQLIAEAEALEKEATTLESPAGKP